MTFNGNSNALLTLTAVIEKTDGTGVIEPIALDAGNDATVSLSVPMEEISEVGLTIGNYHRVSDAGDYTISIDKGVWVPEPSLAVSVSSVAQVMETDTTGDLVVQLSNDGELVQASTSAPRFCRLPRPRSRFRMTARASPAPRSPAPRTPTRRERPLTSSSPSTTAASDDEWLNGASLEFLAGMTVNASTSFVGGSGGDLDSDGTGGDGATVRWYGDTGSPDYYGVIENGESATATVNVTFATDLVGTQAIAYTVDGDQWGGAPHTVFGNLRMGSAGPSVVVTAPNGGESFAVGDDLTITWAAGLLSDVKIDLSRDGGDTWENLVTETQKRWIVHLDDGRRALGDLPDPGQQPGRFRQRRRRCGFHAL